MDAENGGLRRGTAGLLCCGRTISGASSRMPGRCEPRVYALSNGAILPCDDIHHVYSCKNLMRSIAEIEVRRFCNGGISQLLEHRRQFLLINNIIHCAG